MGKVSRMKETLKETLYRDVHDIANSCDKDNHFDIESWIEHITSTFHIYGYRLVAKPVNGHLVSQQNTRETENEKD